MVLRWLSRFKLIRRRRISLATMPRYGRMDGYQFIYCLPPAGGRIRSQGNYCLPPAGGRIRSQGNKMRRLRRRIMNGRRGGFKGRVH